MEIVNEYSDEGKSGKSVRADRSFRECSIILKMERMMCNCLGGDEFAAFVENVDESEQNIDSIMQRLQNQMEKVRVEYPFLSSSVGIYVTEDPCSFETYYIEADKALYETKKQGKSHYTVTRGKH